MRNGLDSSLHLTQAAKKLPEEIKGSEALFHCPFAGVMDTRDTMAEALSATGTSGLRHKNRNPRVNASAMAQ